MINIIDAVAQTGTTREAFVRVLDRNGNGTGQTNVNQNYAPGTWRRYYVQPTAGQTIYIAQLNVSVEDTTINASGYGAGGTLNHGIYVWLSRAGVQVVDFTAGLPIRNSQDWGRFAWAVRRTWGAGNQSLDVEWCFTKLNQVIVLRGDISEAFEVRVHDNMTGLNNHYFTVHGWIETP